jgi:hypothetical protein
MVKDGLGKIRMTAIKMRETSRVYTAAIRNRRLQVATVGVSRAGGKCKGGRTLPINHKKTGRCFISHLGEASSGWSRSWS